MMGNKTKVLNFEENIYNYNNFVINNYPNQNQSTNYTGRPSSSSHSSVQVYPMSSISKDSSTSAVPIKLSSVSSNNICNLSIAPAQSSNNNICNRYVVNLNNCNNNDNSIQQGNSTSNLIQAIKSKQLPSASKERDRRSNSIFGAPALNSKPSTSTLLKNSTIKTIRAINNEILSQNHSNLRSGSINKIDSMNEKIPSQSVINIDNLKSSRKINGKSSSSIPSLLASKIPVYNYKSSNITNSTTVSSSGTSTTLKYNK